jgi:hypothetical protein
MGPAYFPTILGGLLAIIGLIAIVRSIFSTGDALEKFAYKEIALVMVSVMIFGGIVRGAGLVPAVILLVMISAFASTKFRLLPSVFLAVGMAVFSVAVFIKALGLPIPMIGPWFGF